MRKIIMLAAAILISPPLLVGLLKLSAIYDFRAIAAEGNELVAEIRKYKAENGIFPDEEFKTLRGRKKTEFYYSKNADGSFVLWTQGFSVGESIEYDSKTEKWERL